MGKSGPPFTKRREKNSLSNFSIVIDVEGGLISDLFSLWLHPPNNMPNHCPEHFLYGHFFLLVNSAQDSDSAHFLEAGKTFESKPP